jgi:DNA-binding GntR family transcriptional regulator
LAPRTKHSRSTSGAFAARNPARATSADASDTNSDEVSEQICATIAGAIADGALKPGVKLLEDVIAEHFGVSRTVVRGALAVLQCDHLVERKRNRGSFVAEPSAEEGRQLFDARQALERAVVERVRPQTARVDLDRLERLTHEEEHVHEGDDAAAKRRLSGRFHVELAKISGNMVLAEILEKVIARLSLVTARFGDAPLGGCGAEDHRHIIQAIRTGDLDGARRAMDGHLQELERHVHLDADRANRNSLQSVLERFAPLTWNR